MNYMYSTVDVERKAGGPRLSSVAQFAVPPFKYSARASLHSHRPSSTSPTRRPLLLIQHHNSPNQSQLSSTRPSPHARTQDSSFPLNPDWAESRSVEDLFNDWEGVAIGHPTHAHKAIGEQALATTLPSQQTI